MAAVLCSWHLLQAAADAVRQKAVPGTEMKRDAVVGA